MADPEPGSGEERFVVVPLGSDSKKIGQVIGSESCRQILDALTTQPSSASRLAERLGLPLTTVQYDVEKLLEVGLIRVERVARTEKMRQMKIYGPVRKLIVVVPERLSSGSPAEVLKKYLGVFLGILFVGALVEWAPGLGPEGSAEALKAPGFGSLGAPAAAPREATANETVARESRSGAGVPQSEARNISGGPPAAAPLPAAAPAATSPPSFEPAPAAPPHYGLWFVLGGSSALGLLGAAGWALRRKKK